MKIQKFIKNLIYISIKLLDNIRQVSFSRKKSITEILLVNIFRQATFSIVQLRRQECHQPSQRSS